jgi:lipopolysaccharide heptosyltransferase I
VRVLIVKMSALGDIIHALPVLDYLHRVSPGIEIDWVVEEPFREALEGNPLISRLHFVRTRVWRKKPFARETRREVALLKEALRSREYQLLFDIQGNLKSGLVCWLSGVEQKVGFAREWLQESVNTLFTTRQVPMRPQDKHVTDQYLRLVSVPFAKDFREMRLATSIHTSPADDEIAAALLATLGNGLVFLFHCGTTWSTKLWYRDGWVALGKAVLAQYPESTILFTWGSEAERKDVVSIAAAIGHGTRVVERYSLKGLTALLKKVDLVVGADTGPVHLAAAVGTPTVSFYRASDGRRSGPRGDQHVVIQAPIHCTACFRTQCDKDAECQRSIRVEKLLAAISGLVG